MGGPKPCPSTNALGDGSGSALSAPKTDAWGGLISAGVGDNPYDWVAGEGYVRDADSGLIYVRERWYDPVTGRGDTE